MFHGSLVQVRHPKHIKLAEKTRGHWVTATGRRRTGRCEDAVLDIHELQFLQIIKPAMVYDLSQELDWRLGTVGLKTGHIDIVDKDNHLTSGRRPNQVFLLLDEFILVHEEVLDIFGAGLSREVEVRTHEGLRVDLHEELTHDNGLAHTGFTQREDIKPATDQLIDHETELLGIGCGDNNVEEGHFGVKLEGGHHVVPVFELLGFEVDVVIIDIAFEWERSIDLQDFAFDELGVFRPAIERRPIIEVAPHRPHKGKNQNQVEIQFQLVLIQFLQFVLTLNKLDQLFEGNSGEVHKGLHQVGV
jgi:hypothetical protein